MAVAAPTGPAGQDARGWLWALDAPSRRSLRARLLAVLALATVSALPILFLAPLFNAPFERDQGIYATIAEGWLDGAIPYRDLWDNKAPLLFLWYAASFAWLGESIVAPRVAAGVAAALSVPFVWAAARTLFGPREAGLAAAIFALSFANVYLQVTANAEVFMLLPLAAGLWAFSRAARGGGLGWYMAAGILTGLAVFTRQSALWSFIGYGLWLGVIFLREPTERRSMVEACSALAAGGALSAAPFVAYFAAHGALYDLWYGMFEFNFAWAGEFPLYGKIIPPLLQNPAPLAGGLVFWALAGIGLWRLWLRGDRVAWLVLSFLLFSEIGTQTLGKASPHYAVQLLPGAAVAGGVGALYVVEGWRAGERRLARWLAAAAVVTLAGALFAYAQPSAADRFEVQYAYRDYADAAIRAPAIAREVAALTEPGDYVYEWGRESEIYFLADREPASRWAHNRPYSVDKSMIDEVIADLEAKQPKVILFTFSRSALQSGFTAPRQLLDYVEARYLPAGRVEYAELHLLAQPGEVVR
jgi:4-amino-4-deoxy-L-arabinose transferase-like glycosyltransferase